ncbi:hypothetical protein [Actinoplanes regularis]|uniref:hypothetical protein n=1 Tax=Actinoplanes regularis TaxID=52697 RepID=UPI0025545BE0|nr:hypothetical protein [Actinoplanes regularis]GLW31585.1 hypothetical protein Areg01_45250 [Actinoplanes regularis]
MTIPHREHPLPPALSGTVQAPPDRPTKTTPTAGPDQPTKTPPTAGPNRPTKTPPTAGPDWPAEEPPPARPDWRERLTLATDLALIGLAVTVLALPLVTAPAALAAGSAAVHGRYSDGRLPPWRPLLRQYRRSILPGLPGLLAAIVLVIDLAAVRGGSVPGGPVLLAVTALATIWLAGAAALVLVALGRDPDLPWLTAARWAGNRPKCATALAGLGLIAFFLALAVPVTFPVVIGFHLFAIHMVSDRLAR